MDQSDERCVEQLGTGNMHHNGNAAQIEVVSYYDEAGQGWRCLGAVLKALGDGPNGSEKDDEH